VVLESGATNMIAVEVLRILRLKGTGYMFSKSYLLE
jgi:hypothetical protein